jgi:hypothetical protein
VCHNVLWCLHRRGQSLCGSAERAVDDLGAKTARPAPVHDGVLHVANIVDVSLGITNHVYVVSIGFRLGFGFHGGGYGFRFGYNVNGIGVQVRFGL